ncbi:PHD and RING finger domain-containing protein 1 isoform X13 [Lagenorhynchus albirostris]|uniref:PHD and RING finger domain-containing protein 1 isoform X13 n=1 Tax=Lagenorhynchus albirostris TaxID=27610 RepID=UPI0028EABDBB|nr:PHD and RING finger domain-containing protein 1 isoform X13 [Lagenorhynchus albirostris]
MDDDSLDELVDRSPGPDGHPRLRPAALTSDAEDSSDAHSGGSEDDTCTEHSDGDDEEGHLEDGSGSEDSEEDGDDVDTLAAAAATRGALEASGAFNSDDDSESCPICLNAFRDQAVGTPENCAHYFCLDCIVEWSKNANSCPVDRTIFKCICIRAQFGGKILKKIPVESARLGEDEDEDPTFCGVCGRSDREDRLLLCDGCDAGYHMECLDPPLQEVPVDEWFCPECAAPGAAPAADAGPVSEEEVSLLLADVVPTTSRLQPHAGRTRAIARTRQSERVRATVNRNRISTARRIQHVPRYLMSPLLDETIEAVAAGLSTAVYQHPGPRAPARRRRKAGRRRKVSGRKKTQSRSSVKSRSSGTRSRKRQGRVKKSKGKKIKNEATARSRIARTLGLRRPAHGACIPSVYKPADPSLGLMRADIGAASLSLFGDPYELDPFDSSEEASPSPASPLSVKRRILSRSALRSHQPVARPVSMGLCRSAALKTSNGSSNSPSESTVLGQAPRPAPRRTDISELPRIPKIRRDDRRVGEVPAGGQRVEIPSSCISRLTGREGPGQPGCGARAEGEPSSRGAQEPSTRSGGGPQPPAPLGPSRGKGVGSTFESFRINIPGNTAHSGRVLSPGFCNTFRPVDSKVQRRESPVPLFSVRKTKQLKSEIYDPFNPTGSDSSSASSSPEHPGSGLLPSEITRTISIDSPKAPVLPPVRCVTSYTVQTGMGKEPEPPQGPCGLPELQGEEGPVAQAQRPSPPEPWGDEDPPPRISFFGSEGRTVTCVTAAEPDAPPSPDALPATTHRVVELRSPTRSRSRSSSRGGKKAQRPRVATREHRRARSGSRSSHSGDRSSRSASPPAGEDQAKRHRPKARDRRSSSDRSSSRERTKRRKAKDKSRERRRGSWGRGRRRSRSRSGSPGSSSHEHREGRRKKRRRSGSRSRGRECSPHSSLERARRPRHPRERRERPDRESAARLRDRRGSWERRRRRSRSPSPEHRPREHRRPRSREKRPRPRPRSPERKLAPKEASPAPLPQGEPRPDREPPARPLALAGTDALLEGSEADKPPTKVPPVLEVPAEYPPEDLDYGDSVEAGHLFEDFSNEAIFMQLDDMSSPPSPESTDSSPERSLLPKPTGPPAGQQHDAGLAVAIIRREVSRIHGEDVAQPLPRMEGPREEHLLQQDAAEAATAPCALGGQAMGGAPAGKEEGPSQNPLLRAKALVKRVTWDLQEVESGAPAEDRGLRTPLRRPQRPRETEDAGPVAALQQAPFSEPPPPGYVLPEPGFPDADPSQVQSLNLPPTPALPSSVPPYAPVSQPAVQFLLQGSLPLMGCGVAQSPAPVPTVLTAASEPAGHAATVTTAAANSSEERTAAPRPASEKTKNEEYMKKLHVQERAVEEVKLAIKPFYQKREVTKDEYKDILRKAVQKICHSKSGEINPVKVGNLVKAYVDKYRHMRRHRRAEAGEEPPAQGAEG